MCSTSRSLRNTAPPEANVKTGKAESCFRASPLILENSAPARAHTDACPSEHSFSSSIPVSERRAAVIWLDAWDYEMFPTLWLWRPIE
jgi:hypothetical protein